MPETVVQLSGMRRSLVLASRTALALSLAALGWTAPVHAQEPAPNLSSGGLAPPPAVESQGDPQAAAGAPSTTEAELAKADREDSGRGLEFVWLNGELGGGHFGLGTFQAKDLVDASVKSTQTGLVVGGGLGMRLVFLTVGARFRYAAFSEWKLWTLGLEGGLHMPLGAFEPYATLGLGYASVGSFRAVAPAVVGTPAVTSSDVSAKGFDARLGLGFDYYMTNLFSAGLNLTGDMLVLSRAAVSGAGQPGGVAASYASDGSSIGAGVTLTAVGGLHF